MTRILFFAFVLASTTASAQYRDIGYSAHVGYLALGSLDVVNGGANNPWGATDQGIVGVEGSFVFGCYSCRAETAATLGFGGAANLGISAQTIVSLVISGGMRYNFLDEKHRPFVAGQIQYLQMFNTQGTNVPGNAALGGANLWVGIAPRVGYEWFFLPETSVQIDVSPTLFLNLDNAPKLSAQARLAFSVYL